MSGRRKKGGDGGHGGGGEERWLLPYADMITLLLGLFIVLFAMSSIDAKQFDNVKRSLSQTFNGQVLEEPGDVLPGSSGVMDPNAASDSPSQSVVEIEMASRTSAQRFDKKEAELRKVVERMQLGNDVQVVRNEVGIQVRLAGDALFDSGSWALKPSIEQQLRAIERELAVFRHSIEIAGHTDAQPFTGHEFGNYGLGANRANAVAKFFRALGYDAPIKVVSYGPDRPLVAPAHSNEEIARNRRIEITILEPGSADGFPNSSDRERATEPAPRPSTDTRVMSDKPAQVDEQLAKEFSIVEELAETGRAAG